MQEFECSSISDNTFFIINLFVSCNGLKDILSQHVLSVNIIKVIIVDCSCGERVFWILSYVTVIDIFQDELTQFGNEDINVFHNLVEFITLHLFDNVLLCKCVTAQHICDTTEQDGIGEFNVVINILFQQFSNKLTKTTIF